MENIMRIMAYVISVSKDINPRLNIARDYIVYSKSKNIEDKKHIKDLIKNNTYFKTEKEVERYYNRKLIQLKKYWSTLKESDKIESFTNTDSCRIIFRDIIKDDSFMEEDYG